MPTARPYGLLFVLAARCEPLRFVVRPCGSLRAIGRKAYGLLRACAVRCAPSRVILRFCSSPRALAACYAPSRHAARPSARYVSLRLTARP